MAIPIRRILTLLLIATLAALLLGWGIRRASNQRAWAPDHARQAWAETQGDRLTLHDFRSFRYPGRGQYVESWSERTVDLGQLETVWFLLVPLSESWRGPAHTFLSFGFADSTYIAISVEARREREEAYSVWRGMLRDFELVYVVGDEPDLIGRRLVHDGDPIYLYPIRATPEAARALFVAMLEKGSALRSEPAFYHTLFNNCTTSIVEQVNEIYPGTIPGVLASLLPGYSDEVARNLGLIDSTVSLEDSRHRYRVESRSTAMPSDPREFGRAVRLAEATRGLAHGD